MGHVHVAEALGVPCHIMFPQPWYYGTRSFPHPMSGMPYAERSMNLQSYRAFETLVWTNFSHDINVWRTRTLGLPRIFAAASSTNLVTSSKIPFSAMWSPAFVPKPPDWPPQVEVVGTFFIDQKKNFDVTPFAELESWLKNGEPPIFIGFGSMVIKDPQKLADLIKAAAHETNYRIVVQSSWSKIEVEDDSDLLRNVGPCPHDWLLPQCRAVVHHGGAGTTAAGLRYGLPSMVCPFFADQFMWGYFVEKAGVGPKACPVNKLTKDILVESLNLLANDEIKKKAENLMKEMEFEDGITGGLDHFISSLPKESMLCDVSLILGENRLARYDLVGAGLVHDPIKVSSEVAALMEISFQWNSLLSWLPALRKGTKRYWYTAGMRYVENLVAPSFDYIAMLTLCRRHAVTKYNLTGNVKSVKQGCLSGIFGVITGVFYALMQIYYQSDRFSRSNGAFGCIFGLIVSAFVIVVDILKAILLLLDRFILAITNGVFGKDYDYIINPFTKAKVFNAKVIENEKLSFAQEGMSKARKAELSRALDFVVEARKVFDSANPVFPHNQRHYQVVSLDRLIHKLGNDRNRKYLRLKEYELDEVERCLRGLLDAPPASVRRATMFPRIKKLNQMIRSKVRGELEPLAEVTSSQEVGSSNILDTSLEAPASADLLNSSKKTSNTKERPGTSTMHLFQSFNPNTWKRSPKEVQVSFSEFLMSLRVVCSKKCLSSSRHRLGSRSMGGGGGGSLDAASLPLHPGALQEELSQYLN